MKTNHKRIFLATAVAIWTLLVPPQAARADIKLPALIADDMVLQRDVEIPIWGAADPGEKVTVTLGDKTAVATADERGEWKVKLGPLAAGGPFEMKIEGKKTVVLHNVAVGDVWVCSGQSNMQFPLGKASNAATEIPVADHPLIRLFAVPQKSAGQPVKEIKAGWRVCSPKTAGGFSAVGYFFGRDLHRALNVPVGLIQSAVGGTIIEAWTRREAFESHPDLKTVVEKADQAHAALGPAMEKFQQENAGWKKAAEEAKAGGKKPPTAPVQPHGQGMNTPCGLYNGMIAPLVPFAIQGVIWYQGESNARPENNAPYRKLLPLMIQDWRQIWGCGDFSFLIVQLANFGTPAAIPAESRWAEVREVQQEMLALPKTGMAVAIDIGEPKDIHPKNKAEVGRRLALAAQAVTYGVTNLVYSGPLYDSMAVEENQIRLKFQHVGSGLVARGGAPLKGFAIAGEDHKFVWADAKIDGETIVVSSAQVPKPVAVRYGWDNSPVCNLANKEGLPASPFRTDRPPGDAPQKP